jgi:hypothetical protein
MDPSEASFVSHRADDYEWDVFVSYRHNPPVGPFVTNVLFDLLKGWLCDEIDGDPRIFLDTSAMAAGDPLPKRLMRGLVRSRCLLAICSPSYFRSPWCLSEWESFREREALETGVDSLIVPVLFHKGGKVQDYLAGRIFADFTDYTFIDGFLFKTETGLAVQKAIKKLAADVAARVNAAPSFQLSWPVWTPQLPPPPAPPSTLLRLSDAGPERLA